MVMVLKIGLITILTENIDLMKEFYCNKLGFVMDSDSESYVEFKTDGVRFALCLKAVMEQVTKRVDYRKKSSGFVFELAFPVPKFEDVDKYFQILKEKEVKIVVEPETMPWGLRTLMFEDPDGNIHEIYSDDNSRDL